MASKARDASRRRRLAWFRRARFGMFIHWGIYAQLGRCEWVLNRERIPPAEYERLADTWRPGPRPARKWARLARAAGMKYMVMTTKHHDGFCLWDTDQTDYNAARRGPQRDLVAEYVDACRAEGLKVGLYYSLADWHHPDGWRCWSDLDARRRFVAFTHGCVRELCSRYGRIDVLWYDGPWPLEAQGWQSRKMNRMVRRLQPHIIINDRSNLPEDFSTAEGSVTASKPGRAWEACMTYQGAWGYMPSPPERSYTPANVVGMLRTAACGQGNLLLNIGPAPDGSVPPPAVQTLRKVGRWLGRNGEAVLPHMDRIEGRFEWNVFGQWSLRGRTAYLWVDRWLGREIAIGGFYGKVRRVSILADGRKLPFEQTRWRLVIRGLPANNPDRLAGVCVLKIECASRCGQKNGPFAVLLADARPPAGIMV